MLFSKNILTPGGGGGIFCNQTETHHERVHTRMFTLGFILPSVKLFHPLWEKIEHVKDECIYDRLSPCTLEHVFEVFSNGTGGTKVITHKHKCMIYVCYLLHSYHLYFQFSVLYFFTTMYYSHTLYSNFTG